MGLDAPPAGGFVILINFTASLKPCLMGLSKETSYLAATFVIFGRQSPGIKLKATNSDGVSL